MRHYVYLGFLLLLLAVVILLRFLLPDIIPWELVLGVLVGLLTSIGVSLLLSLEEFRSSTAGYRVEAIIKATREILGTPWQNGARSRPRDRHRYSLGVVIDNLEQGFADDHFKRDEWPVLINHKDRQPDGDRWGFFNRYVRPVVEDLDGISFIGRYSFAYCLWKRVRQLDTLVKLCNRLEDVVCELDAAFGANNPLVEITPPLDGKTFIRPLNSSPEINQLRKAYGDLREAWGEWLRAANQRTNQQTN